MALVKTPPRYDLSDLMRDDPQFLEKAISSPEFAEAMRRANARYLHWDGFRRRALPAGFTAKKSWAYLRFLRRAHRRVAPFADEQGASFSFSLPDAAQKILSQIDRWSGDALVTDVPGGLPSRERYVISSLMEEAIASSQLEGAATTRAVAKEMLRSGRAPRDRSEQMIVNNWRSMQFLRSRQNQPMTPQLLCDLQAQLTQGTMQNAADVGVFRRRDDVVVTWRDEVVHQPPPSSQLPERMEAFCRFANNDAGESWLHPVVKAAMLHFWLAYDHPFADGNGRTARALVYWYLLSRGYWLFEYLAISRFFLKAPAQYARAYLYTETDGGDLTYFLLFNLRVIHLALEELRSYLQRKKQEVASSIQVLQNCGGLNLRQRTLLARAIQHPDERFTVEKYRLENGVVNQTARSDLLSLETKGLLSIRKIGKAYVFSPTPDLMERLQKL